MAQFDVADVPGAFARGQQFAQQAQLRPLQVDAAQQALVQGQQGIDQGAQNLQFGQLKQQGLQQEIDQRTDQQKNQSLLNAALTIDTLSDDQIIPFLEQRLADAPKGSSMTETGNALKQAKAGDFNTLRSRAKNLVEIGVRQGDIQPQGGKRQKPTASSQDFQTFKQLNAKAQKTGDPVDIQLAEQFGRQSGFDRETPQELADIEVGKESKKALVRQAATASKEAFDGLKGVRKTIANIDDAIKALDSGAATGPIVSKLPSFRQAAIELDNIKGRMGLDVVGATTFGALSESELAFALNVALPDSLEPAALKDWLVKKKDAQTKLSNELRKAASFLGKPGNTIADYIDQQEKNNPNVEDLSDEDLFN